MFLKILFATLALAGSSYNPGVPAAVPANAILPSQVGFAGGYLSTTGTNTQWIGPGGAFTNDEILLTGGAGYGSTNGAVRRFTNLTTKGTAITCTQSATLGDSCTVNTAGNYFISGFEQAGNTTTLVEAVTANASAPALAFTSGICTNQRPFEITPEITITSTNYPDRTQVTTFQNLAAGTVLRLMECNSQAGNSAATSVNTVGMRITRMPSPLDQSLNAYVQSSAGDTPFWSGYFTGGTGTFSSTTMADVPLTGATLNQRSSYFFPNGVTQVAGKNAVQAFSAPTQGKYKICFTGAVYQTTASNSTFQLAISDLNDNILNNGAAGYPTGGGASQSITNLCGVQVVSKGATFGGKLKAIVGSTTFAVGNTLAPTTQGEWTIELVTANTVQYPSGMAVEYSAQATASATLAVTANNPILFPVISFDTASLYNAATGRWTIPAGVSGRVEMICNGFVGLSATLYLVKNGVKVNALTDTSTTVRYAGAASTAVIAGDYLTVSADSTGSYNISSGNYAPACTLKKIN